MTKPYEVVVVGAGPAGIAAATSAAQAGAGVLLIDDNPGVGGQIWRGEDENSGTRNAAAWIRRFRSCGADLLIGAKVFDVLDAQTLLAESADQLHTVSFKRLILATGARERFLPFPGWTLPNVLGAGGLQALVKSGVPIVGKRVVIAGSGPLLLAVAAYLKNHGARVLAIAEQTTRTRLSRFAVHLLSKPSKLKQAAELQLQLRGVPYLTSSWPVAAQGAGNLESVDLRTSAGTKHFACDYLACGFDLVPNAELAVLLGCELRDGFVVADEFQRTSRENIYCAGEPTGVGGVDLALVEGEIAGLAAAGKEAAARTLFTRRESQQSFVSLLKNTFQLRPELRKLVASDTLICRCEDVSYARLSEHANWRSAKLHTRCGMGPCQGRICGPATEFLFGWNPQSTRPPVFPARVSSLAAQISGTHNEVTQ